jgi:hypothetical protein
MQTTIGGDPATVRLRAHNSVEAKIFLEEERSFDQETAHNPEQVGYLAMDRGLLFYVPDSGMAAMRSADWFTSVPDDPAALAAATARIEARGEDSLPLGCGDGDHGGGCCCAGCLSDVAANSETDAMVAKVLFGRSSEFAAPAATESVVADRGETASPLADLSLAGTAVPTAIDIEVPVSGANTSTPVAGRTEAMAWEIGEDWLKNRRRKV